VFQRLLFPAPTKYILIGYTLEAYLCFFFRVHHESIFGGSADISSSLRLSRPPLYIHFLYLLCAQPSFKDHRGGLFWFPVKYCRAQLFLKNSRSPLLCENLVTATSFSHVLQDNILRVALSITWFVLSWCGYNSFIL